MPSALPHFSRRRLLIGTAALAVLGSTSVACSSTAPPPDVSTLVAQLERARADSLLAEGAAATADPAIADALTAVSSERTAHAAALSDEITRVTGSPPSSSNPSATSASATSTTSPSGQPLPPPNPVAVVAALEQSATGAAQAAAASSGYAAGLLGSIAAACTASHTVALAGVAT